jgi:transcriptional regulator with GAF, ATPase, and Fis domain
MADRSTLFLDEIGDLPLELQGKLLRVLQEGMFERVGGTVPVKVDIRIIAATNRDLREAVDRAEFRSDLYFRISTFPIHLPPLRERRSDIVPLAKHFVRKHAPRLACDVKSISTRMINDLSGRPWPGNVRELESTIERALISSSGVDVLDWVEVLDDSVAGPTRGAQPFRRSLQDAERDCILEALEKTDWVIEGDQGGAATLGLAPSTLRSKMRKLGISRSAAQKRESAAGA